MSGTTKRHPVDGDVKKPENCIPMSRMKVKGGAESTNGSEVDCMYVPSLEFDDHDDGADQAEDDNEGPDEFADSCPNVRPLQRNVSIIVE